MVIPRQHVAFFKALEENRDPAHAGPVLAGLLTMRLVSNWAHYGPGIAADDSRAIAVAREIIQTVGRPNAERDALLSIVNTIQNRPIADLEPVVPLLLTYAEHLEHRGAFALARDVYETIGDLANDGDPELSLAIALVRLGNCIRKLGNLDEADETFARAARLAAWRRDSCLQVRAEVGRAVVSRMRGNMPAALEQLEELASRTGNRAHHAVRFDVVNELASTLKQVGNLKGAVWFGYEALQFSTGMDRERSLLNLGVYLLELGRYDAARDALMVIERTTAAEEGRILARLNLITVAARTEDRPLFDRCYGIMANADLPPEHRVNFLVESAKALGAFGSRPSRLALLGEAAAICEEYGLHRSSFEVDRLQRETDLPTRTIRRPTPAPVIEQELRRMAVEVGA